MIDFLKIFLLAFFSISSIANSAQYKFEILESKYSNYSENWVQGSFIFDTSSLNFSNVNLEFSSDPLFDPTTFGYGFNIDQLNVQSINPVKASFDYNYEAIGGSGKYFVFDYSFLLELPQTITSSVETNLSWSADISRIIYSGFTCNMVENNGSMSCEPPYGPNGDVLENKHFLISNQSLTARITAVPEPENLAMLLAGFGLISLALRQNKQA